MNDIIASTYEIKKRIGAGGGGTVYLARHIRLDKDVVLKADRRKLTTRTELLRREVDALKNLSHPHIPQVYDYFVEDGIVYTVIDFIQGESLDKPLKRGEKYPQPQVIKWARQLLDALSYLHSPTHGDPPRGYVHSDIKPANIMREPNGDICLIDFNIALALGEENVVGLSEGYASPEHYGIDYSTSNGAVTHTDSMRYKRESISVSMGSTQNDSSQSSFGPSRQQEARIAEDEVKEDGTETKSESRTEMDDPATSIFHQSDMITEGFDGEKQTDLETPLIPQNPTTLESQYNDTELTQCESKQMTRDKTDVEDRVGFEITSEQNNATVRGEIYKQESNDPGDRTVEETPKSSRLEGSVLETVPSKPTPLRQMPVSVDQNQHRLTGSKNNISKKKTIIPDVRSDIYSVGATLYHLLSGVRPAKDAMDVVPLSKEEFSPLVVDIITKAMNPNPDLRFQTAEEMLAALNGLFKNDPRVRRLRKQSIITYVVLSLIFVVSVCTSFVGLKRIQTTETWLKLVEYSKNAFASGDIPLAVEEALAAIPKNKGILTPDILASSQDALTTALGIYDLSDGYKPFATLELPSEPLFVTASPGGKTFLCIYKSELSVYDAFTCKAIATFPVIDSALAEADYLGEDEIVFAAPDGITVYNLQKDETLWKGQLATGISVSADNKSIAAVYKDETNARVYDSVSGELRYLVDFGENQQSVTVNDKALNPEDNLFSLNKDGTLLAVSFIGGGLRIFNLLDDSKDIVVYEESEFSHYEGGFCGTYLAFSATGQERSVFVVIDASESRQTGGFSSTAAFHVQADESGVFLSTEDVLVEIEPESGDQREVAYTENEIIKFKKNGTNTIVATTDGSFAFFGKGASLLERYEGEMQADFVNMAGTVALVGSFDSPILRVLQQETHMKSQVFTYDSGYKHSEARWSADRKTVMLFRYDGFRLFDMEGKLVADVKIPDANQVYDQQYRRSENESWLEIIYNDGRIRSYSATDGMLISEVDGSPPSRTADEEFITDRLRIEAPYHETAVAFDRKTGKVVALLEPEANLTYVTQIGKYIITEYVTTQEERYGLLLNEKCEVIAHLPYLCDVLEDGTLLFDDMLGNLRQSRIYTIEELIALAETKEVA